MQASVKLGLVLAASALAGLAQAQPGAAQTETVGGARSGDVNQPMQYNPKEATIKKSNNFVGTPLKPQPYQGQPVPTYNLQNAWPKKAAPAPTPVVRQPPPPAPRTPVPDPVIRRLPSVSTSR